MSTDKTLTLLTDDYHDVQKWNDKLEMIQKEVGDGSDCLE